ncbi:T9SS type B sorting domain-containing protein [Spirosoma terrae]|uniref:Gliding motility-associated C-terminal domain-containing protein n=1 Tax=Spirosoma terrae TaxID=1968276 RepID=A0A6L9L0J1_9BACT|nr:gliding motility-associated C-terminal domain-containing protein [Spirosoma terrae]NDU93996.1 gliding motility-associated C-terminal domain-containing protein [Spirosoma terrae]
MRILRPWPLDSGVRARWIALIWTGLFVVLSVITQAQNYCVNPQGAAQGGFTLEKDRVCLGDPVRITASSPNVANVGYNFEYNGNGLPSSTTNQSNNLYNAPGSYTIIQVGSGGGAATGTIFCRVVTVLPRNPIKFTAKPCAGRQVTVNVELDASTGQYDNFIINWGDGQNSGPFSRTDIVNPQTHTYTGTITNPTIYILGTYNAPANCGLSIADARTTQQTVTLTSNASAPIINELTTTGDNTITIRYQATGTVQLLQKDASGIFAPNGQTGTGSGTFTVQANTKQVQCFQIQNQDACSNTATSKSDQVCSLVLDAKAASKQNDLSWPAYSGSGSVRRYTVSKGGSPIGSIVNPSASSYSDNNNIKCGVQYCYSIEATVTGTAQAIVKSNQACVTGIDNEPLEPFTNVLVSVENDKPRIVATLPATATSASYTMTISRSSSPTGPFQVIGTTNQNVFTDESANVSSGAYCYQLTYQTGCGQVSAPSATVCTVFLSSQSSSGIDWTTGSPFTPAAIDSYSLEIVDSVNNTKREISMGGNTHYEPDPADPTLQSQRYRVVTVSSTGVVSYSNFFTFRRDPKILVPDAFTPNGDGTNDTFLVKGIYVDQFRMTIFSRWGEPIFTTDDRTRGWDGTINGQLANPGQYMYRIEVIDLTNQKTVRTGALLLIR